MNICPDENSCKEAVIKNQNKTETCSEFTVNSFSKVCYILLCNL